MPYRSRYDQIPLRRLLRKQQTPMEAVLWSRLRRGRLMGLNIRRQHGIGPYVLDFFCPAYQLAIEIDGSQHFTEEGREYDKQRTEFLAFHNIRVIRFSNGEVNTNLDGVLESIVRICGLSPSVRGGDS